MKLRIAVFIICIAVLFTACGESSVSKKDIKYIRADSMNDGSYDYMISEAVDAELMAISSVQYIPLLIFESRKDLDNFVTEGSDYFMLSQEYNDDKSFDDTAGGYDDDFFKDYVLAIVYVSESSGSNRHSIGEISVEDERLSIPVKRIVPEIGTTDMADWFIFIAIDKSDYDKCTEAAAFIQWDE